MLRTVSPATNSNGTVGENQLTSESSASKPPIVGPSTKPIPKAAPTKPKFFVRSAGELTSAMLEKITAMLPPVKPGSIRAANSSHRMLSWMA